MPCKTQAYETQHMPHSALPVHRHDTPYAALVLDGNYEEASVDGRFACTRGTMIVHPGWHAHGDSFGRDGAIVLNLDLPQGRVDGLRAFTISRPDDWARLAHDRPADAAHAIQEEAQPHAALVPAHWLVTYVEVLFANRQVETGELARRLGVSAEHASRTCKTWFGVGPSELRREGQLRRAIAVLRAGGSPSDAVHEAGFCDQPHLTRFLKRMTGLTPARLRVQ